MHCSRKLYRVSAVGSDTSKGNIYVFEKVWNTSVFKFAISATKPVDIFLQLKGPFYLPILLSKLFMVAAALGSHKLMLHLNLTPNRSTKIFHKVPYFYITKLLSKANK